jgi:hypothetical protein
MQEGTLALMQLAKTCAALERLKAARVPFISVMSDPTTGGVFASYAVLGDVNLAEPNALIGFAGARVTAGTIAQELPVGFQRAEFLYQHGFLDRVVHRRELRHEIVLLLRYLQPVALPDTGDGGGFSPLGFLSALADRVVEPLDEPATAAARATSNGLVGTASRRIPRPNRSADGTKAEPTRRATAKPAAGARPEAPRPGKDNRG